MYAAFREGVQGILLFRFSAWGGGYSVFKMSNILEGVTIFKTI